MPSGERDLRAQLAQAEQALADSRQREAELVAALEGIRRLAAIAPGARGEPHANASARLTRTYRYCTLWYMFPRLAKTLKAMRKARRWSQPVLAKKAGLSAGYLARLERSRHDPRLSTLLKLAKALGVDVAELLR